MDATHTADADRLFAAIGTGDTAAIEALLAQQSDLLEARSPGGVRPLTAAIYVGAEDVVRLLRERGAEPTAFEAAALGDTERLHALLDADPELVHACSDDGWTALHLAGHFGRTEAAALLLDRGADIMASSRNRQGNTPLHAALAGRRAGTARLLVQRGADVNLPDAAGWTPLHLAAHEGNVEMVRDLLEAGADPHAARGDGQTPLGVALAEGNGEVAGVLRGEVPSGGSARVG
jgi:ankyrin repeat protein